MRHLVDVIDAMLARVPKDEGDFIARLESCQQSVTYTPPEVMGTRWHDVAEILYGEFGEIPDEGWQTEVCEAWNPGSTK